MSSPVPEHPPDSRPTDWPRPALVGAAAVSIVTLVMRSLWLGRPDVLVFDEIYYASDAVDLLARGTEGGHPVHPPLGKWMISLGVLVGGFEPWAWRLVPLLAGALVAGMTWLIGWRLTESLRGATIAAAAVVFDGIMTVTGRLALLDGLATLWTTLALLVMVDMARRPLDSAHQRRARWLLGVVIGLGIATKWSAALLVPVALVVALALDQLLPRSRRLRAGGRNLVALIIVPSILYVAAHAGFFANYERTTVAECPDVCETGPIDRIGGFVRDQADIVEFHRTLEPSLADAASSLTWIAQSEPVRLFVFEAANSEARVLALGNPVVWILGALAVLASAFLAVRRRHYGAGVVVVFALVMWLPWAISGRAGYSYYGAPLVPALGAALAIATDALPPRWQRWWGLPVAVMVVAAVWLWPVWTGAPLSPDAADRVLVFEQWR